jgi:hypothetical protein
MKRFLLLSLVLVCGCSGKITQEEKSKLGSETGITYSDAPVIIIARIIELKGCDKYCDYDIEIIKVIRNSIKEKLDSHIMVRRASYESHPELNKTYILELDYYNDNPKDGLKIIRFKEKSL